MKILLVDTPNILVRRFYAQGGAKLLEEPETHNIDEFLRDVIGDTLRAIESRLTFGEYDDHTLAVESPKVWRYEEYDDYKFAKSRPDKPRVALGLQRVFIPAALDFDLKVRWAPKMEADDVLATMVHLLRKEGFMENEENEVALWTNDSDIYQLLRVTEPNVVVLKEGTQDKGSDIERWDGEKVAEELGIDPVAIPLLKAIAGDSSDNLEGIKGIGPKTVAKMLRQAPFREPVPYIADPDKVGKETAQKLLTHEKQIKRDTKLACLRTDATLLNPAEKGPKSWRPKNQGSD